MNNWEGNTLLYQSAGTDRQHRTFLPVPPSSDQHVNRALKVSHWSTRLGVIPDFLISDPLNPHNPPWVTRADFYLAHYHLEMNLHVCAKVGPDRTTGDDVYTVGRIHTQTDRQTDTHTLSYIDIDTCLHVRKVYAPIHECTVYYAKVPV